MPTKVKEFLRRRDYRPPDYQVSTIHLDFRIFDTYTWLRSKMKIEREAGVPASIPLVLNGEIAETKRIAIDDVDLNLSDYQTDSTTLVMPNLPSSCTFETEVILQPKQNSTFKGLYYSDGTYLTDLEPTGFRQVTWFPDRPDIMARYHTRIEADRTTCPVLLANGNRIEAGDSPDGRHWAIWEDPFPKPSYIFALVAGNLHKRTDFFTTASGRRIALEIWVAEQELEKCEHAMESLKRAMQWEEEQFGKEYDLDTYMIVAVRDFNGGAMENKGLNIFNSKYVLADPATATDDDYELIDGCVAHEYFHNWTGNRVTLRSWFELTLKEGLTVFRDQKYSEQEVVGPVKRLMSVCSLRINQFPQDASALVHAIRPDEAVEFLNLYTKTVYDKGAEVVRMYETLLGPDGFRRGMDLYFDRHDGKAVSCDDFLAAMADANNQDLSLFGRWYEQSGTPLIEASGSWNPDQQTYQLRMRQSLPARGVDPGPLLIPICIALFGVDGKAIPLQLTEQNHSEELKTETTLWLQQTEQHFEFKNVDRPVVPSLLRGFSAPVRVSYQYSSEELAFLLIHETDPISRWDAAQQLAKRCIYNALDGRHEFDLDLLRKALTQFVLDESIDPALRAFILELPHEDILALELEELNPTALCKARRQIERSIGEKLGDQFRIAYEQLRPTEPYHYDHDSVGRRRLRNRLLKYLCVGYPNDGVKLAKTQFETADNMTDQLAALQCLANTVGPERQLALSQFYDQWQHNPLVIDKWFAVQASAQVNDVFEHVEQLACHPSFIRENPNRFLALLQTFSQHNLSGFHRSDGRAYSFLAKELLDIDAKNPQSSAKLVPAWRSWFQFADPWRTNQRETLEFLSSKKSLSTNVREQVERILETE